ncbi:Polypyrimidine tract-binding protein 3 [Paragonimus heterotremus]|uniref:Polypyrimidine tract-binding protein 3 n=1 Tax=Paragonimus heterotremus TaxID=100268 RepID=A0A8J4SKA5_9TREM|nr:Polypyrimidine tract-binding protein 3 [Paragonimus heterotremus]
MIARGKPGAHRVAPPWLDKPLLKLMKSRQNAWKRYRQCNTQAAYDKYKQIRNLVNSEKKRKRQLYEQGLGVSPQPVDSEFDPDIERLKTPPHAAPQHTFIQGMDSACKRTGYFGSTIVEDAKPRGSLNEQDKGSLEYDRRMFSACDSEIPSMVSREVAPFVNSYRPHGSASNISVYDPNLSNPQKRLAPNLPESQSSWSSKKARHGSESGDATAPSRVLFVRNLPSDVTEADVANLAIPFGAISNMVLTKSSGFGLIEMLNMVDAEDMVDYYSRVYAPSVRGKGPVAVTFSRYPSLTTTAPNQQISEAILNANKQFAASQDTPGSVLRAQLYQVPPGVHLGYRHFHRLFSQFGRILRIVTFKSGAVPNAFIEFENPISTHVAVLQTDGTSLNLDEAPGSPACIVHTDFSRQPTVEVRSEDSYSRDFIRNPLPDFDQPDRLDSPPISQNGLLHGNNVGLISQGAILEQLTEERLAMLEPAVLSELASRMVKPLLKAALSVGGQQANFLKSQAEVLEHFAPHGPSFSGGGPKMTPGSFMGGLAAKEETGRPIQSPVVYVSNLNKERVTPDTLFLLFGVYGDVQRVKILHNKKDSAMVQLADCLQAQAACNFLDKCPLYGKSIRCTLSKNMTVTIPVPGKDDSEASAENINQLNREYVGHRLHRFRRGNPRNIQNLCPPSKVLHITNLPADVSEEDITDAFIRISGCPVDNIKLFKSAKPRALVQLADVEKAITALLAMHDYELETNFRMCISFSKTPIRP